LLIRVPLATLQVDICDGLNVTYSQNCLREADEGLCYDAARFPGDKLYHAGVKRLSVRLMLDHARSINTTADYTDLTKAREEVDLEHDDITATGGKPEEEQYVTQLVSGKLITEAIKRVAGEIQPVTERELAERNRPMASSGGMAVPVQEWAAQKQAALFKGEGNDCFGKKEYSQGAVFYTQALEQLRDCVSAFDANGKADGAEDATEPEVGTEVYAFKAEVAKLRYVCLSNRSACFLKLGQPERALADSEKSVAIEPNYCKGQFRLGLAFHALERYPEAVPALEKALKLEPKNKQVKVAIGFAEMKARKQAMDRNRAN
jgi:tetratricopeptide (TPR) repeat protein